MGLIIELGGRRQSILPSLSCNIIFCIFSRGMKKGNPKGPWSGGGSPVVKTLPQGCWGLTGLAVIMSVPLPQPLLSPGLCMPQPPTPLDGVSTPPNLLLPGLISLWTNHSDRTPHLCYLIKEKKGVIKVKFLPWPRRPCVVCPSLVSLCMLSRFSLV